MKMNKLGRTGLTVSEICLGTMTWGSQNPEAEAHAQMDLAVSEGVNFFDTAEMYPTTPRRDETLGLTETIIGTWFAKSGKRDDVILATKVLGPGGFAAPHGDPITPAKVRRACEDSLKRLQTDHIDIYQLHWPNRGSYHFRQTWNYVPSRQDTRKALDDMAATLTEIGKLRDEGKIRHFGLSNDTVWGAAQYVRMAEDNGLPRVVTIQNEYSLLHRIFDTDWAEFSHHEDVGLIAYSPLATGLLTGKYENGAIPSGSRLSINTDLGGRISDRVWAPTQAYVSIARKHGLDPAQMALAFVLSRPFMTAAIIGATSLEQLKTCIGAKDVTLSEDVLGEIAAVYQRYPLPM